MGAPYIYDISRLRVNTDGNKTLCNKNTQDMAIVTEEQRIRNTRNMDNKKLWKNEYKMQLYACE